MKVFLINMDDAKSRLDFMTEQLTKQGVEFERVSAVNGKKLRAEDIKKLNSVFLQFCARGYSLNRGEIGCSMSHMSIWRRIVDENIPKACIMEDDVTVLDTIRGNLEKLEKIVQPDENAAYLISAGVDGGVDGVGVQPGRGSFHTCGYVVSRTSAAFLLKCNTPLVYPCDAWHIWESWGLKFYKYMPRSVAHWNRKLFGSMNDGETVHRSLLVHKVKRLFGKPIELIYRYYRKKTMRLEIGACP